jgi:acyl carrier protein
MNKTEKQVVEVLEDLCLAEITELSQTLLGDLAMDSLRMVMLLVSLEDTFGIELDESDMNPFALVTVADVVNLVSKYVPETEES